MARNRSQRRAPRNGEKQAEIARLNLTWPNPAT
jgi:hypothetical protein